MVLFFFIKVFIDEETFFSLSFSRATQSKSTGSVFWEPKYEIMKQNTYTLFSLLAFSQFADSWFTFGAEERLDAAVSGLCVFTGGGSGICD